MLSVAVDLDSDETLPEVPLNAIRSRGVEVTRHHKVRRHSEVSRIEVNNNNIELSSPEVNNIEVEITVVTVGRNIAMDSVLHTGSCVTHVVGQVTLQEPVVLFILCHHLIMIVTIIMRVTITCIMISKPLNHILHRFQINFLIHYIFMLLIMIEAMILTMV